MPALPFDQLLTAALLRRFHAEGQEDDGDGRHCGVILRDDGDIRVHHPYSPPMDSTQILWAARLLDLLNRELHHDGAWVIVFTHPSEVSFESALHAEARAAYYRRYGVMWLDKDADVQFTMDWMHGQDTDLRDFTAVVLAGIEATARAAETSWGLWKLSQDVLDHKKGRAETYKRARGEKAPSLQ